MIDIEQMAAYHYDWSEVFSMNSPKEPEPGSGAVGEGHRPAGRILRMTSGGPKAGVVGDLALVVCERAAEEGFIGG